MKAANLPVLKDLNTFDAVASSIPIATFNYITSLEWVAPGRTCCWSDQLALARATSWLG